MQSFFTRWRNAVRRVPRRGTVSPAALAQQRKQRRLINGTLGVMLLLAAGGYAYTFITSAPDRARAEMALGVRQMGPANYAEAIRHFDRAIDIWPQLAEAYLNRAVAEHQDNQRAAALMDLEKSLDLNPNLTRAYNERGQIHLEGGDSQKAIEDFSGSLRVKSSLEGYYQRGQAYEKLGQHEKAIADFDAAISEFREAPYAYRARATSKRNSGDREGANLDEQAALRIENVLNP